MNSQLPTGAAKLIRFLRESWAQREWNAGPKHIAGGGKIQEEGRLTLGRSPRGNTWRTLEAKAV